MGRAATRRLLLDGRGHLSEALSDMLMTLLELWSLSLARMGESVRPVARLLSSPARCCLPWLLLLLPFAGCSAAANEHSSTSELACPRAHQQPVHAQLCM